MYKNFFKRLIDILLSLISLILLSPIMLVTAILVRIKLGSPIIFAQERPGKDEKIFKIYKFRSMTDERDENGELLPSSKRLTPFGKKLRSTSLDELPELFNILKGDMSLVGPRPLAVQYLPYYNEIEKHRHDVRPGLTGLAQVNGRNNISWDDKFKLDIEYVYHITFINDLKIIFKTFYKVIKHDDIVNPGTNPIGDFDKYRKAQNKKIENRFFKETKFNRARTALQGHMGTIMMDDEENPSCMIALVGRNCFVDGNTDNLSYVQDSLKMLDNYYKVIIASDNYKEIIEEVYKDKFEKSSRYSTKRVLKFDEKKLKKNSKKKFDSCIIKKIDTELMNIINDTDSCVTNITMSDYYEEDGIGFCAIDSTSNKIVGIATSNMVYDDGIEVNIKVDEKYRHEGIATVLCSNLILECLRNKKYPYWDAFNETSLKLAKDLGYELDEEYTTYRINKETK